MEGYIGAVVFAIAFLIYCSKLRDYSLERSHWQRKMIRFSLISYNNSNFFQNIKELWNEIHFN